MKVIIISYTSVPVLIVNFISLGREQSRSAIINVKVNFQRWKGINDTRQV